MKFYVYQDITKDIEWSKSTHPNGDAETLKKDLKFKRLVQLGELGEQYLKPIKKKGNIILYTGNALAETYGDLVLFNRHSIIGEDENTFSDFIPQMNKALLIREYTMYKHLFKFRWDDPATVDEVHSGYPKLRQALSSKYGWYFNSKPTVHCDSIGDALVKYFNAAMYATKGFNVNKIANLPNSELLFQDIMGMLPDMK